MTPNDHKATTEKAHIIAVLETHRGTAARFCAACDWQPTRAALDADDFGDSEERELREHQADMILSSPPATSGEKS